jgi:hypothetical protein
MNDYIAQKFFEIWRTEGESSGIAVFAAGPEGDQARAMERADGGKLVHVFSAYSELDCMQKYYDYAGFGTYRSEWPDLAIRPYHFVDGLKNLEKLKKPPHEMRQITMMGDGSTRPNIPDPMPMIVVQDKAVFSVGIWIKGEFGGHTETPINEANLIAIIEAHLRNAAPQLLENVDSTAFICPMEFAEQMQWPLDGRDPAEPTSLRVLNDQS